MRAFSNKNWIELNKSSLDNCAQCSPRHACPLKGALLMQVHDRPQGAPVLALAGVPVSVKRMQNHAPYACMAFLGEKGGIFGNF